MITVALGVTLSVIANVVLNSGEGFVKAISDKLHLKFGNVKIAYFLEILSQNNYLK